MHRIVIVMKRKINKRYEATPPVGRLAVVQEPVATARKYVVPIYGDGTRYGGLASFIIKKIKYVLFSNGSFNADFNLGLARPDLANELRQLQFEIENVSNQ